MPGTTKRMGWNGKGCGGGRGGGVEEARNRRSRRSLIGSLAAPPRDGSMRRSADTRPVDQAQGRRRHHPRTQSNQINPTKTTKIPKTHPSPPKPDPIRKKSRQETHLLLHVIERIRRVDGEADQDDVGVGVGEGPEPVIVFLAGRIPQGELDVLAIDLDVGDVVLEDGRNVDLFRLVGSGREGGCGWRVV